MDSLKAEVTRQLVDQGVSASDVEHSIAVSTHYDGSDTLLQIPLSTNLKADFIAAHLRETSFSSNRSVRIANIRVRGVGRTFKVAPADYADELEAAEAAIPAEVTPTSRISAFFEVDKVVTKIDTPVYVLGSVSAGSMISGPAIIVDSTQTIIVELYTTAFCLSEHVILRISPPPTLAPQTASSALTQTDPIMLAVFANRFMSIAEQMGHTLQRTSISVSIKERLDFSCSIHGTDGALVANAPHIPVHLGSMQYAVQAQHQHWLGKLRSGDVLLTNHPQWGG